MAKPKITRIKAGDSGKSEKPSEEPTITRKKVIVEDEKTAKAKKAEKKQAEKKVKEKSKEKALKNKDGKKPFILFRPFVALGHYLRDSWREIRQVRWPNRKATWKMVAAVLVYTALFVVILTLLDMLFSFVFNKILG